ncbi:MAG: Sec-independent protein translocase protein TatB [Candidatus Kryptoniota bacterium]
MFENIGFGELILILLVIIIFFGPKRIPDIAQSIGKGIREFKRAMRDVQDEIDKSVKEEPKKESIQQKQIESPSSAQELKTTVNEKTDIKS